MLSLSSLYSGAFRFVRIYFHEVINEKSLTRTLLACANKKKIKSVSEVFFLVEAS
jgi:hypothetical protein